MKFTVTITLDNDAFDDALRNLEVADMLHEVARRLADDTSINSLTDWDGNTTGTFGFSK